MTPSSSTPRRRRRLRRGRGDRGLAMVEFAVVAPLLALLVAGILEFGTAWRDNLTVTNATRSAARVASNLGDARLADYEALVTLDAAIAQMEGVTLDGVLIFDASAADGRPAAACFDAGGNPRDSSTGNCNYYSAAEIASLSTADFPGTTSCAGALDVHWCPVTERQTTQSLGLDDVGVWMRIERDWYTGVFPGTGFTITDTTVMRLEPDA